MLWSTLLFPLFLLYVWLTQDTSVVQPEPAPVVGWQGYLIGYILSNILPLGTAWLTQKFLNIRDNWYAQQSDVVKRLVYVAVTTLLMLAVQVLGVGWDATADAPTIISKLAMALASTFLVHIGIKTEMARSTRSRAKSRRA